MAKYGWDTSKLSEIVANSTSIRQVLLELGLAPAGDNYYQLKKVIREQELSTAHFERGGKFRKGHVRRARLLEDYLVADSPIPTVSDRLKKRLIREGVMKHRCQSCGLSDWLGEPIPLELHHLNSDRRDNRLENLQLLCPNCHARTSTYRALNVSDRIVKKSSPKHLVVKRDRRVLVSETIEVCTNHCEQCGVKIGATSTLCLTCYRQKMATDTERHIKQRRVERPPRAELLQMIEESGYEAVGRKYGVTGSAIRKWLKTTE